MKWKLFTLSWDGRLFGALDFEKDRDDWTVTQPCPLMPSFYEKSKIGNFSSLVKNLGEAHPSPPFWDGWRMYRKMYYLWVTKEEFKDMRSYDLGCLLSSGFNPDNQVFMLTEFDLPVFQQLWLYHQLDSWQQSCSREWWCSGVSALPFAAVSYQSPRCLRLHCTTEKLTRNISLIQIISKILKPWLRINTLPVRHFGTCKKY